MDHLYSSVVRIERMQLKNINNSPLMAWFPVEGGEWVDCRLDLSFLRPGKDQPAPVEAGKAPDRIGVMLCAADVPLRAGDRIVTIDDENGTQVVRGIFEIRVIPDLALDYDSAHHMEVQVLETNQHLSEHQNDLSD